MFRRIVSELKEDLTRQAKKEDFNTIADPHDHLRVSLNQGKGSGGKINALDDGTPCVGGFSDPDRP
jgi:hypothetical protein